METETRIAALRAEIARLRAQNEVLWEERARVQAAVEAGGPGEALGRVREALGALWGRMEARLGKGWSDAFPPNVPAAAETEAPLTVGDLRGWLDGRGDGEAVWLVVRAQDGWGECMAAAPARSVGADAARDCRGDTPPPGALVLSNLPPPVFAAPDRPDRT